VFFIVEKDGIYAHANEWTKAFEELEFKIASEKLKHDPIYEDTLITIQHYRAITGACDLGCRDFMDKNNIAYTFDNGRTIEKAPIRAIDLLSLLKKSNAYGVDKFASLIATR
jgi:hypothetical protein